MNETPLPTCPQCHTVVGSKDYYCYNCGKNLKPKPLSTSISAQLVLYIESFLLPPMGIIWGFRYLRQKGIKPKIVGMIAIIGTVILLIAVVIATVKLINTINLQMEKELRQIGY